METYRRLLLLGARTLSGLALVKLVLIEIWTILTSGEQWMELVPDRDTYRVDFSSGAGVNELLAAVLTVQQEQGGEGAG